MFNICLTFDYELFFGKNYCTPKEVLFNPTYELVNCLTELGVSATFFVDVCSVVQARKYNQTEYIQGFEKQLLWMNSKGQDIQLHIHPHWLKSLYEKKGWIFSSNDYRIHTFGFERKEELNAYIIIKEGKDYLTSLLDKQDNSYKCIAYRAGGFCLQPSNKLIEALYDAEICIDSSIAPKLVSTSKTNCYNFKASPKEINWWIGSDASWNKNAIHSRKKLFEVPIGTENKNAIIFCLKRLLNKGSIQLLLEEKRGSYINESEKSKMSIGMIYNYLSGYNAFSMDSYNAEYLYGQLRRFYRKHRNMFGLENSKDTYICLIGHPKLVTKGYISNLEKLINMIKSDNIMSFSNMTMIYNSIKDI